MQSLDAGKYTFYVTSDDGYRLWINNQLVIDKWMDKSVSEDSATITLRRCTKNFIRLEYYDNNSSTATCILKWGGPGIVKQVIPTVQLYPEDSIKCISNGTGLLTQYFSNTPPLEPFPATPTLTKIEPNVNFTWVFGAPPGISVDSFKARFTGYLQSIDSGEYTLYVTSDDGYRLWINNQLVIDRWIDQSSPNDSTIVTLPKCTKNDIKLEYYENQGNANCILEWSGPGITRQVIPISQLYPADTTLSPPDTIKCASNGTGLLAQYFSNTPSTAPFPATPTLTKTEPTVNFNWGSGGPPGISVDSFKARFTGYVQSADSGKYTFYVSSDDGYRLWINNQLMLDKWEDKQLSEDIAFVTLSKCAKNTIKLEYYENKYNAVCILKWSGPGINKQVIPTSQLYPADSTVIPPDTTKCIGNGTGLLAQYYSNTPSTAPFPSTATITKTEPTINFNWKSGGPSGISVDSFKARFTGYVQSADSGKYTFYVSSDDGHRLWINNQLVMDKWIDQSAPEDSVVITLAKCTKNIIKLEYYENKWNASCVLQWSGPGINKQVIPTSQLYPVDSTVIPPDTTKCISHGTGLLAQYYSNTPSTAPFPSTATITKTEPTINFNWKSGGPSGISVDSFKARFTGYVQSADSGKYTFYVSSDDGHRLWINNQLVMDKWIDQSAPEDSVVITLAKCTKNIIKLEYYENKWNASCVLQWSGPGINKQVIPTSQLYPVDSTVIPPDTTKCIGNGTGLLAQYYSNTPSTAPFPSTATITKTEPTINFNWKSGGPSGISVDSFKARFTGYVQSADSGKYTFYVSSDDGHRLWINNQLVMDKWIDQSAPEDSVMITLAKCTKNIIKLEYYENKWNASCVLQWSGPGINKQVIPTSQLYPVDTTLLISGTQLFTDISSHQIDNKEFIIYPNPNGTHTLNISTNANIGQGGHLMIYNTMGQLILSITISDADKQRYGVLTIPISLSRGVYLIKLFTDNKMYSSKFIVL